MARISGVDLPKNKRIEIALTYIYGIGRTSANKILAATGINPDTRVKDLTEQDEAALREVIGHDYIVEGDLRRNVAMDVKRLTEIGCYRGLRHRKGLPVRGQRSKTNARTRKGPKRTVANKKKKGREESLWLTPRRRSSEDGVNARTSRRVRSISALPSTTPWSL